MTGVAPPTGPDAWRVLWEDAFDRLQDEDPPEEVLAAASEWIVATQYLGPPTSSVSHGNDAYVDRLPSTAKADVEFLLIDYEFLVIIRRFVVYR